MLFFELELVAVDVGVEIEAIWVGLWQLVVLLEFVVTVLVADLSVLYALIKVLHADLLGDYAR